MKRDDGENPKNNALIVNKTEQANQNTVASVEKEANISKNHDDGNDEDDDNDDEDRAACLCWYRPSVISGRSPVRTREGAFNQTD